MNLGKCSYCNRRWRSASQKALYDRRQAILTDLRASKAEDKSAPRDDLSRHDRHLQHSMEFRARGESAH